LLDSILRTCQNRKFFDIFREGYGKDNNETLFYVQNLTLNLIFGFI